jgi:PAS domain S-box-containing protein
VQVWTSTPEGDLDFVSERVVAYFETSAEHILGHGWHAVLHPDDVESCVARWAHSLATGEPYEIEFRLRRGDGCYRWHLSRATPERAPDQTILRWFGTNTDIHEAKIAHAELRARSEYEQRLIGIVSHDLRNPLSSIGLGAALLSGSLLDPATSKTVARIARSADRAARLITDLLDFAKARIGTTIPINPRPTNLREIVEHVVDELQLSAPTRIVRIGHHGVEDGRWDADRIAQVISNLVGNALQHAPPDVPITVESRIDGDDAFFAVRNDGPPIPSAELGQLFEPFKRGRNAAPGSGSSLGLGLYIAREVVIAHGGTIEVESHADTGTQFTVRMPRFVDASVAA